MHTTTIDQFYTFSSKLVSTNLQAYARGLRRPIANNRISDIKNLVESNYTGIDFPVIFKHVSGKVMRDIIDTGTGCLCLISDRFRDLLVNNGFTGWQSFPITLLDKKDQVMTGYQGLSITGRCGPKDYNKARDS